MSSKTWKTISAPVINFTIYDNTSSIPGDADLNGSVNVLDAITMVSFILDENSPSEIQFYISDLNSDGSIDIIDIINLITIIIS